jgi:hypothetical protein
MGRMAADARPQTDDCEEVVVAGGVADGRLANMSSIMSPTPTQRAASATLNVGHSCALTCYTMKSVTRP